MYGDAGRSGLVCAHVGGLVVHQILDVEVVSSPKPCLIHDQAFLGDVAGQLDLDPKLSNLVEDTHRIKVGNLLFLRIIGMHVEERFLVELLHPVEIDELGVQAELRMRRQQPEFIIRLAPFLVSGQGVVAVLLTQLGEKLVLSGRRAELHVAPGGGGGELCLDGAVFEVGPVLDA